MEQWISDRIDNAIVFAHKRTWARGCAFGLFFTCLLIAFFPGMLPGQSAPPTNVAAVVLPDNPVANYSSGMELVNAPLFAAAFKRPTPEKPKESLSESIMYHSSQVALVVGFYRDMRSTLRFMEWPQHVRYRLTCGALNNGVLTYGDCGQWYYSYFPDNFVETGWAVKLLGINNRNTVGVVSANLGYTMAVLGTSALLHKAGGTRLKKLATGLNLWKAYGDFYLTYKNNASTDKEVGTALLPGGAMDEQWYNP